MVDPTIPQMRRDFYVYILFRPDGRPCYVGKGCGKRDKKHEKYGSHNPHLSAIIKNAGGSLPAVRFRDGISDAEAHSLERLLIAAIGREIHGGPLVNQTDGGEGVSGAVRSPETLARMSAAQMGKKASRETKRKHSLSRTGRIVAEKTKAKLRVTNGGKPPSQNTLAGVAAYWSDPANKERHIQRNAGNQYGIGNMRTPDGQARVTLSITEANKRRGKSGKPTIHKGATPWVDEGMSRTSWYRKRAAEKSSLSATQPEFELRQKAA